MQDIQNYHQYFLHMKNRPKICLIKTGLTNLNHSFYRKLIANGCKKSLNILNITAILLVSSHLQIHISYMLKSHLKSIYSTNRMNSHQKLPLIYNQHLDKIEKGISIVQPRYDHRQQDWVLSQWTRSSMNYQKRRKNAKASSALGSMCTNTVKWFCKSSNWDMSTRSR